MKLSDEDKVLHNSSCITCQANQLNKKSSDRTKIYKLTQPANTKLKKHLKIFQVIIELQLCSENLAIKSKCDCYSLLNSNNNNAKSEDIGDPWSL